MASILKAGWLQTRLNALIARPDVQSRLSRWPIAKWIARRDGAEVFGIVQGFVASQVLMGLLQLGVMQRLSEGRANAAQLALALGADPQRLQVLLQAGAALRLLRRHRDGRFGLSRRGAALLGVPGLPDMILHHGAFLRDLEDPCALARGKTDTELSRFWPYVLSAETVGAQEAERYSDLMAQSQRLVAEDTLQQVDLTSARHLMDIGGGSGAFLAAVAARCPDLRLTLFDLPQTGPVARSFLSRAGLSTRVEITPGSFKTAALPGGADVISLVRVLYDHGDETVRALLARIHEVLPAGGRLIVTEPMSGGARPDPITDVYFAVYTMAMGTGRTRSAAEISALLQEAGFAQIRSPRPYRRYITQVIEAVKQA